MELTVNARKVLEKRYLRRDEEGNVIETPEDLFQRVARTVAQAEELYGGNPYVVGKEFYELLTNLEFLPNSPTLFNAGNVLNQLSGCFVVPVEDSMEGIFSAVGMAALIQKSGGGTGFSFSRLRPKGDRVSSTGGVSSGPISFMKVFSAATDVVTQASKRHGANMGVMSVYHPDIMEFIECKKDGVSFSNFNISVAVDDAFMRAVKESGKYSLVNPRNDAAVKTVSASDVFERVVHLAWRNGDPGLIFLDRINRDNPTPHLGSIEATNPCGEQPLLPFESCNLGSINLSKFVSSNGPDVSRLIEAVKTAVRFLDDVIDVNVFPNDIIEDRTKQTRKIGLGVMGFADALIKLGIPYNSEGAITLAKQLMSTISREAVVMSEKLGQERGNYPAYKGSGCKRNACVTTIAPTGSLSLIAGCSSGVEPVFALAFKRIGQADMDMEEVNPLFLNAVAGLPDNKRIIDEVGSGKRLGDIASVPESVARVFVTAHEISSEWHVRMQSVFQEYVDNAVSKTINFPNNATVADVRKAYLLAHELGCKGITVYRDGSRDVQVLTTKKTELLLVLKDRPIVTVGHTELVNTGCGHLYVTVNRDPKTGELCEVFAVLGRAGGCASAQLEVIGRLVSIALRAGQNVPSLIKHLRGVRCPSVTFWEGMQISSCADAVGWVLEKNYGTTNEDVTSPSGMCPECGGLLSHKEGCYICESCGYTKC